MVSLWEKGEKIEEGGGEGKQYLCQKIAQLKSLKLQSFISILNPAPSQLDNLFKAKFSKFAQFPLVLSYHSL